MRGRRRTLDGRSTGPRRGLRRFVAAVVGLGVGCAVLLAMSPAQAAARNVHAQLALSGLSDKDNPAGGSQIGVHPGDSVTLSAASVPTEGLAQLGLSSLIPSINHLLDGATRFRVRANFAHLPGGHNGTILSGKRSAHFSFAHTGRYSFTWTVQKVTVLSSVLGKSTKVSTINLNGNELRQAGVKLNAHNQYVGTVVVNKHPPKGGISVQLPGVHVSPSAPVVGRLPGVNLPGVSLPTVHVSAPKLPNLPTSKLPGGKGGGNGGGKNGGNPGGGGNGQPNFAGPPTSVPQEVVPQGNTSIVIAGSDRVAALPAYHGAAAFQPGAVGAGNSAKQSGGGNGVQSQPRAANAGKRRTVDLASQSSDPSGQLPVLLAIIAIIALALVAGTYARLFLIKRRF
jgi:hypothetical protein